MSSPSAPGDGRLHLGGAVARPFTLTLAELAQWPSVDGAPFALRCFTSGRHLRDVDGYRGVRLTELLTHAGLPDPASGDFKRTVFVAVAHDGYAVTFSWHELFNTAIGEQAMVAYAHARDGTPLEIADGAPLLFSGADRSLAPRHLKRLASIFVQVLAVPPAR